MQTFTDGAQCTANFVYYDASNVYIGQAAHCSGTGGSTDDRRLHARVAADRHARRGRPARSKPGTMVYNSWITMQANGETDPDTCAYNDLALVKLDPADVAKVNPSIPFWGGPNGIGTAGTQLGRPGLQLRQLLAARRRHPAEPEARLQPRRRRQRLEPHRLHRDARHPR